MKRQIFLIIILFLAFGYGFVRTLSSKESKAYNGEGSIIYKITYSEDNPYKDKLMLPHETNLFFKGTKASFITNAMGMVQMVNLLDDKNKKFTSMMINTLGENFAFSDTPEEVKEQENSPEIKIEPTTETKMIAGLECNKAVVKDLTHNKKFDIYFYSKIRVYLGNSPYKDFNYLLMEYQDTRYGLPMILEAKKVDFNPIDTSLLTIHGNYKWVDKSTFLSIVQNTKIPL